MTRFPLQTKRRIHTCRTATAVVSEHFTGLKRALWRLLEAEDGTRQRTGGELSTQGKKRKTGGGGGEVREKIERGGEGGRGMERQQIDTLGRGERKSKVSKNNSCGRSC